MADIASLALEVRSDQVKQATAALREMPKAASAAERAAEKWKTTTASAARSSEDFSKRVRKTIADLEFERQQLARSATERARHTALRRAGVSAASEEGRAITASVRALQAQRAALNQTSVATRAFRSAWEQVRGVVLAAGAALGVRELVRAADAFTRFQNSLRVAGVQGQAMAEVQNRLFAAANKNGVEIGALAQLYSRASIAANELGASQDQLLKFVDGVTAALRLQGGSTQSASGALLQLSQALGSGIVRAEEFNSILEGAFPIAQAAARGIDGMGGSVAKLRTAIASGQVTSREFFEGLLRGLTATEAQAAGMSLTVGQALTVLNNSFTRLVGVFDQSTGATALLSSAIVAVGRAMDAAASAMETLVADMGDIAEAAAVAGTAMAVAFGPAALAAMAKGFVALGVAGVAAIRAIGVAILANPIGAIATGIAAAVTALYYFRDEVKQALGVDVVEVAKNVANIVIGSFVAAYNDIGFVWANFPDIMGDAATRAGNRMITGIEAAINFLIPKIKEFYRIINPIARLADTIGGTTSDLLGTGIVPDSISIPRIENTAGGRLAGPQASRDAARRAELSRDYIGDLGDLFRGGSSTPGGAPSGVGGGTPGAAATAAGKAAAGAAKKYAELTAELELTASAQAKMTEAAQKGEVAFQEQEATLQAQQKLLDIFNVTLDETDPRLRKVRDLMLSISQGKMAEAFAVATAELEKQNVVLEAQIALMNEAPEIQAREIALIKAKQEAEKAGTAITDDMIEARRAAIEQNETLKSQQEEIRRAQELWTEPLKRALGDIQSSAADAFEEILESGKINFESLGQIFKKIVTRMAAEFLALATIRPVMNVIVNAVGGSSSASGGGGLGDILSSVVGRSSGGGGGGILDALGNLFSSSQGPGGGNISGFAAGAGPLGPGEGAGRVGGAIASQGGFFSPATGLKMGSFGMGNLSGALGVGMGALSLANSKSTGQTIGGIGQMVGGALMMIPTPWTMAAGAIISLASSILPGLFEGTPKPINSFGFGQLSFGGGSFNTSGGAWGPNADMNNLTGPLGQAGKSISAVFDILGGVQDASRVFGIALESFNQQYADGSAFNNQTSFIVDPSGNRRQFGMGSTDAEIGLAAASAEVAIESILGGAVGEITENMRKALEELNAQAGGATLEQVSEVVSEIKAFDDAIESLGKTITPMESAFNSVDESLSALYDTAEKYALDTAAIDEAQWREKGKIVQDFIDGLAISTLEITDPTAAALQRLDQERAALVEQNDFLVSIYGEGLSQIAQIEALHQAKRKEILEDANAEAIAAAEAAAAATKSWIDQIQDLVRSLTPGGALANVDPRSQLAGLEATYRATFAQASAGDVAARDRFTSDASAFAEFAKSFFAGSSDYNRIRDQILADAETLQLVIGGGTAMAAANSNLGTAAITAQTQQLMAVVEQQSKQIATLMAELSRTNSLLSRYVANAA